MILIGKEIVFLITNSSYFQHSNFLIELVSITVSTMYGKTQFTCVYAPPGGDIPPNVWDEIFSSLSHVSNHIFCGDFNARNTSWGDTRTNIRGSSLLTFSLSRDLLATNTSTPTRHQDPNGPSSNLDLIFCSSTILQSSSTCVVSDAFSSDHLLVLLSADLRPVKISPSSIKINLEELNWPEFRASVEQVSLDMASSLCSSDFPAEVYDDFISGLKRCLLAHGAFIPRTSSYKPFAKPLWWNAICDKALSERRDNYRWYQSNQTAENKAEFKRRNEEIKHIVRPQKAEAFRSFCKSMTPDRGCSVLWRTLKALSSRTCQFSTNISTDI